mgnify:CR=1 FL=1
MAAVFAVLALVGLMVWVAAGRRPPAVPAPEDDVTTPIDRAELEAAERELLEDSDPGSFEDEADDDWGPGVA